MNRNDTHKVKKRGAFTACSRIGLASFFLLSIASFVIGCRGNQGPAGQDGASFDTVPPSITLLEPAYGDTLQDTLRVSVRAEDNVGIDEVAFFLDGSDQLNDSTWAFLTDPPYVWTYDLFEMGIEAGFHTVMVRAYDTERNHSDTPSVLVYVLGLPPLGPNVLTPAVFDSLLLRPLPTRRQPDPLLTADTLLFARFSPERNCRIDSVRIWLDSIPDVAMHYDSPLRIGIHHSNGVYPTDTVTTMLMPTEGLSSYGWHSVKPAVQVLFDRDDRFHITVSVEDPSDTTSMAIGETLVPAFTFATENRSGYYSLELSPPGWVTFQETLSDPELVPELIVEVYVYYLP
ncbi:MAG: Ig-like domain-containing protein [bacterium]